ncbi:MAG TPA: hypothetical protein VIL37_02710 [Natronosporangium sp.]
MPTRDRRNQRRRAGLAAAAMACLLLAACDGGDDPTSGTDPTTPAPTEPAVLVEGPTASDGGEVAVTEIGFSVLTEHDTGEATVTWAAFFDNTSQSDLLATVNFQLTWEGPDGQTEQVPAIETDQQRAYDVLPGRTAMVGGVDVVDFVPTTLDVSVGTSEWYPMTALQARSIPVGVEVTDYRIDPGEGRWAVRVTASFTSSYERQASDEGLRLLVAIRDSAGTLIGGAVAGPDDFPAEPAGEREQEGFVEPSLWPAAADLGASEVTVIKVCCAWVAAG